MQKKIIAAADLIFLVHEELALLNKGRPTSVAIIPDPQFGWTAMTSRVELRRHPQLAEQIAKVEAALRQQYRLQDSH